MPTPSLLIVPARFKSGKLYSQIPTSGAGDFTVTRATEATRVNASGLIELVASGIPRLDYFASGGTVGCPALLVEPSGSNLALQSSNYSLTWLSAFLNSTSGVTSPSGTNDATLFESTSTGARIRQAVTLTSGTTYTFSWFGKFGSLSSGFTMNVFDENATTYGSGVCQAFNLNDGTLGASGTVGAGFTLQSVGMENYGNGWYRCRMTVLVGYTPGTPRVGMRLGTQLSGGRPIAVVSGTINLWGAQLETGSVATSYIPTTTGSVTRNADVVSVSGAVSGSIGQTEGTMYCEFEATNDAATRRIFTLSDGTSTNRIMIYYSASAWRAQIQATSISLGNFTSGYHKIAFAYQQNGVSGNLLASIDGGAVVSGTSATFPTSLSMVTLGKIEGTTSSSFFNARIRVAALYTTRLTDAQLQALTSP